MCLKLRCLVGSWPVRAASASEAGATELNDTKQTDTSEKIYKVRGLRPSDWGQEHPGGY